MIPQLKDEDLTEFHELIKADVAGTEAAKKLHDNSDNTDKWESSELGADERYVQVASYEEMKAFREALGDPITIQVVDE